MLNKLNEILAKSSEITINNKSKIVIMSDCHRGSGGVLDNYLKNKLIHERALKYYYKKGYTYIELGDGDELWEVDDYKQIIKEYINIFRIIKKFHQKKRLIMIYGNHDINKRDINMMNSTFSTYYNSEKNKEEKLLFDLKVEESIVLRYKKYKLLLIHGHQIDFLSGKLIYLAKFLVRNFWRVLERRIIKDPTDAMKNYPAKNKQELKLKKWSLDNNILLIAGHTHHPIFPKKSESRYFNSGSCIHPNGISCLEIENGCISLVKWIYSLKKKSITIDKVIVENKELLSSYF